MKRLSLILSRKNSLTIYKPFLRPNLDCIDIRYDKPFNESLKRKIETVQYKAALVITGAIKGTSCDRLYQELGIYNLINRMQLLSYFVINNVMLFDLVLNFKTRTCPKF